MKDTINSLENSVVKILVIDDDRIVRDTISKILEVYQYTVVSASSGEEALILIDETFHVIILDINMPGMDGFATMERITELKYNIPVLFLTGAGSMEYAVKAINIGGYDFLTKPLGDLDVFNQKVKRAVEKRQFILKENLYKQNLEEDLKLKTSQLEKQNKVLRKFNKTIEYGTVQLMTSLQNAMEEKDFYTAGHTIRVTEYALMLGLSMGLPDEDLMVLRRAAQFHDVGKLVIDLSCIQKPGKLTIDEWELIKKHPEVGANIIKPLGFMDRENFIIRHHHERVDGKGYPDGLTGYELDNLTKILIIVDSYDAMTSKRNYRVNLSMKDAIQELKNCSGTQFDGEIVDYFCKSIVDFVPSGELDTGRTLDSYLNYIG
ncbi:MAG: response regulator [Desulfotalea sp.]